MDQIGGGVAVGEKAGVGSVEDLDSVGVEGPGRDREHPLQNN